MTPSAHSLPLDEVDEAVESRPLGDGSHVVWQAVAAPLGYPAVFYLQGSKAGQALRRYLSDRDLLPLRWPQWRKVEAR